MLSPEKYYLFDQNLKGCRQQLILLAYQLYCYLCSFVLTAVTYLKPKHLEMTAFISHLNSVFSSDEA